MDEKIVWYDPKIIDMLQAQLDAISPETWHMIMNPMCGQCLAERGKALIEGRIPWRNTPLNTK
jgi:hypothetical protein